MYFAFNGRRPQVGSHSYVSDTAQIIGDVAICDNCYIGHGTILRGDYGRIIIGAGSAIEEAVVIHAPPNETAEVGERVTVGHGAIVHGKRIGALAVIGMGAILSIGSEVGDGAIIGEGSVVTIKQVIPARVVALGNPARMIREVNADDVAFWEHAKQLYVDLAKEYLEQRLKPIPADTLRTAV
jgi:carbonic anhydrase/acetyltransferase-like protein (isoleucine patch superfamily)